MLVPSPSARRRQCAVLDLDALDAGRRSAVDGGHRDVGSDRQRDGGPARVANGVRPIVGVALVQLSPADDVSARPASTAVTIAAATTSVTNARRVVRFNGDVGNMTL